MNKRINSQDEPQKSVESEHEDLSEPLCLVNLGKPTSRPRQTTNFDDFNPGTIERSLEAPGAIQSNDNRLTSLEHA